jgi:hypothetical protein
MHRRRGSCCVRHITDGQVFDVMGGTTQLRPFEISDMFIYQEQWCLVPYESSCEVSFIASIHSALAAFVLEMPFASIYIVGRQRSQSHPNQ